MKTIMRVLVVCAAIGMVLPAAEAQTPLPTTTTPKLTMPWLASLGFSPSPVVAGSNVTGTVTLLRPAVSNLTVALTLADAVPNESVWVADGAISPINVTVLAGRTQATFTIVTSKPANSTGSKTYSVTASYGNERKSASFTTTQSIKLKQP